MNRRWWLVAGVTILGIFSIWSFGENNGCNTVRPAYRQLSIRNSHAQIVATITVEDDKVKIDSTDEKLGTALREQINKEGQIMFYPIGGRCWGTYWDGVRNPQIGDQDYLLAVDHRIRQNKHFKELKIEAIR